MTHPTGGPSARHFHHFMGRQRNPAGRIRQPPQSQPSFIALDSDAQVLQITGPAQLSSRKHKFPADHFHLVLVPVGRDLEAVAERLEGMTVAEFSSDNVERGYRAPSAVLGMVNGGLQCGIWTRYWSDAVQIARGFSGMIAVVADDRSRLAYLDTDGQITGPAWNLSVENIPAQECSPIALQASRLAAIEERINDEIYGAFLTWNVPDSLKVKGAENGGSEASDVLPN